MDYSLDDLIKRFHDNHKQYTSGKYDEANTRVDFIDPFFVLLGWDVNNSKGLSEKYREVRREDKIKIRGSDKPKAPDYSFRIGQTRVFFVEAKKPSVDIKGDPAPAFQLRRYAYSAELPLSILTDFEEFAVYDTRIKPNKNDNSSVARVFYCTFREYAEKFDYFRSIFSRDAIQHGAFDRYAEDNLSKKGTSKVDQDFLNLIEDWRMTLAKNIASQNATLTIHEINYVVQKIIDRLIFLRIAEDRDIEPYGNLREASENRYQALLKLCVNADQKYNSGLFAQEPIFENLKVNDKILKPIINGLYYPDCPYEFSVLSTEILGSIYEQFLGKTIYLTPSRQTRVDNKPAVRKAGGVFYTPGFVVDYIVGNTLGAKLKNMTPDKVSTLRIVDPACGSGSFVLSAYRLLLDWHLQYYSSSTDLPKYLRKDILYQQRNNEYALTIREKQRILLNNIYGVDIDSQAVEVTKLSLLLKLMEDESQESVNSLLKYSDLQALPDLSKNIRCGNALVSSKFYHSQTMGLFDESDVRRINVFDWDNAQNGFAAIIAEGGFDAVIGNPPYIQLQKFTGEPLQEAMATAGYQSHQRTGDIYCLFYEQGYNLLKQNGILGYITSNKWTRAGYGELLRNFLLENTSIQQIIDLSKNKIFRDATVDTHIVIFKKRKVKEQKAIGSKVHKVVSSLQDFNAQIKQHKFSLASDSNMFTMANIPEVKLKQKLEQAGTILKNWDISIYRGIVTGFNDAFIINEQKRTEILNSCGDEAERQRTSEIIRPLLRGRNIKPYHAKWAGLYVIGTHNGYKDNSGKKVKRIDIREYPALKEHLHNYLPKLKKRQDKGDTPYNLRNCAYYPEFDKEKIIYPNITTSFPFIFDKDGFLTNDTCFFLTGENLKYIAGVLNSATVKYWIKQNASGLGQGTRMFSIFMVELPIPLITTENKAMADQLESLVDQITDAHKRHRQANIAHDKNLIETKITVLDKQINSLVYQLYGLNTEDIKIIEAKNSE